MKKIMNLKTEIAEMQRVAIVMNAPLSDVIAMRQTLCLEKFLVGFEKIQGALSQAVNQGQL